MDVIAACRVLVAVHERGSVTGAAASIGIAQSVASRRLLALEAHLGGPLLERRARRAALTTFGRDLLPAARRLVVIADDLEGDAARARLRPVTVAVPTTCDTRDLAVVVAAARAVGTRVEFRSEPPRRRAELVATLAVRAAVVAVPVDAAHWTAQLGAAGRRRIDTPLRLDGLRRRRGHRGSPRDADAGGTLYTGPEDDVPHVRDVLLRAGFAAGLVPGQLPVEDTVTALAGVLADGDLLLCTSAEASALGLHWRPVTGVDLTRGSTLVGDDGQDVRVLGETVADELAAALGAVRHRPPARARPDLFDGAVS